MIVRQHWQNPGNALYTLRMKEYGDTKPCGRCREDKPLDAFALKKSGYRSSYCRECVRADAKARRLAMTPEQRRERDRAAYEKQRANPSYRAKSNARVKKFKDTNPDRVTEYRRNWEAEHPDKAAAKVKRIASRRQRDTLDTATRYGTEWSGHELELIADNSRTARELAVMLGRSYRAVATMRHKLRHKPAIIARAGILDTSDNAKGPAQYQAL